MAKYLFQGNYVGEGVKGLLKEGGSSRRTAIERAVISLGGTVEAFYYAFGDSDVYVIVDLPDNVSAVALLLMARASGTVSNKTTVLLTTEELDEAAKKTPAYRPPGQ